MKNNDIYDEISKNLILNDCQTLEKIIEYLKGKEYDSIFCMGVMPYFAMCSEGILKFFEGKSDYDSINVNYGKLIKNIRSKIKMYNDKVGRNINKAEIIHKDSNNYFAGLCKFEFVKYLGLYDDFGVYITSNKYIGNTFLYSWYFENSLNIDDEDFRNKTLFDIGNIVGITTKITLNKFLELNQVSILNQKIVVYNKDYLLSRNRIGIFNDKYNKYSTIILFNILCSINFVLYLIGKILPKDNQFYFRIKFHCYYSSISSLLKLINYTEQNNIIKTGVEFYSEEIKKLAQTKNSLGEKSKLRNCLSHYRISQEYIEKDKISIDVPFYGLIEKYTGKDYYTLNNELENNLRNISSLLEKWILN